MIVLIEIVFVLAFLGLLIKAIIETVCGVIMLIQGLIMIALGYTLKFVACIMRLFGH